MFQRGILSEYGYFSPGGRATEEYRAYVIHVAVVE
jgi:hypothetical protein